MLLTNKYKRIGNRFVIIENECNIRFSKKNRSSKRSTKQREYSSEKVYIYGLFSPILNKYFYVGQTNNPDQRFHSHKLNKDDNIKKKYHIQTLKDNNMIFRLDVFAEISKTLSYKWEQGYIKHLRKLGHPLTNRENQIEIEGKDIVTNDYIETLLSLDDEPLDYKSIEDVNFLINL